MKTFHPAKLFFLFIFVNSLIQARAAQPDDKAQEDWAKAEEKFKEHYKIIDPNLRFAQVKSLRLKKLLPDWRVYIRVADTVDGRSSLFLVNRNGTVSDLGDVQLKGENSTKSFQVKPIAEFMKSQKIKIETADDAVEVAKLFEELQSAPNYVNFLKINTNSFTVFDRQFMEQQYGPQTNWTYTPRESAKDWTVTKDYVGPPAMVRAPPIYKIELNDQKQFIDIYIQR